jgi:hypothetical protein
MMVARRLAGCCISGLAALLLGVGCHQQQPAAPPAAASTVVTTEVVSTEPGQIELSAPKVTLVKKVQQGERDKVRFEVNYRFVKGKPDKHYMCEITFPGTSHLGAKPMHNWELKSEGVIKDEIELDEPPVQTFEIRMSEADSPQNGYKVISNIVSGPIG